MRPKLDLSNVTYLSIIGNDSPKEYTDIDSIIKIGQYSSRNINFGRKVIYTHKEPSVDVGDFEIVKIDDFKINVCGKSLLYLLGTTIDWTEDIMGNRFTFENPNATGKCGCGTTFSV